MSDGGGAHTAPIASVQGRNVARAAAVITVELEGTAQLRILADTFEEQSRLQRWLRRPAARRRLVREVADALQAVAA